VKTRVQNLFTRLGGASCAAWVLPALTAGLGLILAGPVAAQTFTNLHGFTAISGPFPYTNSDGAYPRAGLIQSVNTLYGTAALGGRSGYGTVFAVNTDGTNFTILHTFTNSPDGAFPVAGLILSGSTLYGTASSGGSSGYGTVFKINTNGTGFTNFYSFTGGTGGGNPQGGLILSGTNLYGTTFGNQNDSSDNGTVFRVSTNGAFTTLHIFTASADFPVTNSDGANPQGGLILSGTNLYGTAVNGGTWGNGTVFRVNTNGTGFTNLHSFTATSGSLSTNSDGANPAAGLILSGNTLYGTAGYGGSSGAGTVFALNTNGTVFTTLYSFTGGSDGANPEAGLILTNNTLYGTAGSVSSPGNGTVFALNTNGTGFTTLHSFTGGSDGAYPRAGLIQSGNTLYGTAFQGGSSGNGTVFKVAPPPPILSPRLSAGNFLFSFQAFAGASYTVQQNTNLAGTNWIAFTNILGSGTVTQLTLPTTNAAQLFFRVRQP
jgi:uncharacterized repeat protein (TIGR03803 family)